MRVLIAEKREVVEACKKIDPALGSIVEARLLGSIPVLTMARRLERMAKKMRELAILNELNRP